MAGAEGIVWRINLVMQIYRLVFLNLSCHLRAWGPVPLAAATEEASLPALSPLLANMVVFSDGSVKFFCKIQQAKHAQALLKQYTLSVSRVACCLHVSGSWSFQSRRKPVRFTASLFSVRISRSTLPAHRTDCAGSSLMPI